MVSGLHRNGDAPVADHRPPAPTICRDTGVTATEALQLAEDPTVLANDRNGGRLRLNVSRHDDDDDGSDGRTNLRTWYYA